MGLDMAELRRRYPGTRFDVDRHGNPRWYTINPKGRKIRMRALPGSDAWVGEYQAIRAGLNTPATPPERGSVAELIAAYMSSPEWEQFAPNTRRSRSLILKSIRADAGDLKASEVTAADVRAGRDKRRATPAAANNRMKMYSALYSWGIEHGYATVNPAKGVKRLAMRRGGYHSWTVAECLKYEAAHPVGTMARLVYALALYTASRGSDIHRLGPQHIQPDGSIRIEQQKTLEVVHLPVVPPLREAIDAVPGQHLTFCVNALGRPFTIKGLQNKFRDWCDQAGLPQCTLHGLRKALAARLADLGLDVFSIGAVTGHRTLSEIQRYTAERDQKALAKAALEGAFGEQNVPPDCPPDRKVGGKSKKDV